MDSAEITKTIEHTLAEIQSRQGLKCPPLNGQIKPLRDLERFDSPMSIGATGKIGRRLGIRIPAGMNIFGDSKSLYTISNTSALLFKLYEKQHAEKANV